MPPIFAATLETEPIAMLLSPVASVIGDVIDHQNGRALPFAGSAVPGPYCRAFRRR